MKRYFWTEVSAGLTTFMTMSYIIFANPSILSSAGIPLAAGQAATCLGAALACALMGMWARYPFALAPGMGLNAFLVYTVCQGMGYSWQTGMAVVFVEGVIITVLVFVGLRQWVMDAIPMSLKHAIGIGIGLFIAFIGLRNGGLVESHPATVVTLGVLSHPHALVAAAGLMFTIAMITWRIPGAILWGIVFSTVLADWGFGIASLPASFSGMFAMPDLSSVGGFTAGLSSVFSWPLIPVILSFLLVDFFDTMGTVIAVGAQAGFVDYRGRIPRIREVLYVDSLAATLGGVLGCSSITTYIESASGVAAGGRRGLTAVTVAVLFLVAMFVGPLAAAVPACAVAPALVVVGYLMTRSFSGIEWTRVEEGLPAFLTMILMPLTFSISTGIGWGIMAFVAINTFKGKIREIHPLLWVVSVVFALAFSSLVPK